MWPTARTGFRSLLTTRVDEPWIPRSLIHRPVDRLEACTNTPRTLRAVRQTSVSRGFGKTGDPEH
jgi:hypothetical protein